MSVLKFIFPFIRLQKASLVCMSALCIFWSMKEALFPYYVKRMIDVLSKNSAGDLTGIMYPAATLVFLWFLMECAMRASALIQRKFFPKLRTDIRKKALEWVSDQPTSFFEAELSGNIGSRLSMLPLSCEKIVEINSLHIVSIGCAYGISLFLFFSVHWSFFLCALLWCICYFLILFSYVKRVNHSQDAHSSSLAKLNGKLMDVIANISSVRLFSQVDAELENLNTDFQEEVDTSKRACSYLERMKALHSILSIFFLAFMIVLLAVGWRQHFVSLGDFMLIPMLTFSILSMIWWLGGEVSTLLRELRSVRTTLDYLTPKTREKETKKELSISKGEIDFKSISFGYTKDNVQFEDFKLKIHPKEMVGLVGPTGAGKSTLTKLLLRLYPLKGGVIEIDGFDISSMSSTSLYNHISVIPQDPILFNRSINDNIAYGNPYLDPESLIRASKLAHCAEFIEALPNQYQTLVGENGVKLSSGQRQRIAIARAFVKNAPILIVDEATSSLDAITERNIYESIENLRRGKTTIIIAHRLMTLKNVDRILVLDRGRIVEEGSFDFLTKSNGLFSRMMHSNQFI